MKKVKRLNQQFSPSHYDIHIELSPDKTAFSGEVTISGIRKGRPSERLTLHQKGLKITHPKITYTDKKGINEDIAIERTVTQNSYDEIRLHSSAKLYPGNYTISMKFSGTITSNMDGIYPCHFKDGDEDKQLIATQFESHHAREAFPCIDEPEAKATFQLTLTHAKEEVALSNTLPISEKHLNNRTTTTFGITPKMSTYLLAFVVGELESKETHSKSGVRIRTFATKNQVEHTAFALEEAAWYLDFYENYYDIPFPLEKCDFVALPDFASGAMENWGLITFREQTLLVDPTTSLSTKQYVAIVVAHELTHQWFGNLVTMKWWTDLWLNEGFASWMEYLAVHARHPEWHVWTQFAVSEQQSALKMDALENTHPIEVEVKHPDEIRTIFDIISYQKGASVIHMLHTYLGAEAFQKGLQHYLKKFAYQNTVTIDLWQALEDKTGLPVKDFMHAWTTTSGYPILRVSAKDDHLTIEQSPFVTNPLSPIRSTQHTWPVPLLNKSLKTDTLTKKSQNIVAIDPQSFVKINVGQTGFYRVDYTHEIQSTQIDAITSGSMHEIDRMGLLSDGFEVTRAGYQPVTEYLDLLESFGDEETLPVWEVLSGSIATVRSVLSANDTSNDLRDAMKPFVRAFTAKQLRRLGFTEQKTESHLDTLLRPIIIGLAASADEESTLNFVREQFDLNQAKKVQLNPNLRDIVYATIARLGGNKEFDIFWAMHQATLSSDEKLSLTTAMTSFEQPELHEKVLKLLRAEQIKFQDVPYWIAYSLMNRHSRSITWIWMQENWGWMKEKMGTDLSFSRFPVYAARSFADEDKQAEYTAFFTGVMEPMIERSYAQGLEMIQTAVSWRKRDSEAALRWFLSHPKR